MIHNRYPTIHIVFILFSMVVYGNVLFAQTDYGQMSNWYFHPDKPVNLIGGYKLDISVIDKNLMIDSTILIANNSEVNTGIDIFWVHPTQLTNPPNNPTTVAINDQPYSLISSTIIVQGGLLAQYGRFYALRYQQATPASFLDASYSDMDRAIALIQAYSDVKTAFEHYLLNHNNGNRIILAGHSQGSFMLAMLLRDMFDNDEDLRAKLLTASLGGYGFYHAEIGNYSGGNWENIPLCVTMNQCACIHTWKSFKESQQIPNANTTIPIYNPVLVDSGLVYRNVNLNTDWFVQDSLFYNSMSSPLRYYIAPDASYNLGGENNFIAFDSFYSARYKRDSNTEIALALDYESDIDDQRPNDLLTVENSGSFSLLGYHSKDYHIYLWALMQQIDAKIEDCNVVSKIEPLIYQDTQLSIYPNPNYGEFTIEIQEPFSDGEYVLVTDVSGKLIKKIHTAQQIIIQIENPGLYFVITRCGIKKVVVN